MNILETIAHAEERELTSEEIIALLSLDDASEEAFIMRGAAAGIVRRKTGNSGYIFGQIGVECSPCPGNCSFCSCAEDYTSFENFRMDTETLIQKAEEFTMSEDLHTLYLMTMHEFDIDFFTDCIRTVKKAVPSSVKIVSNTGDTSYENLVRIKEAGAFGIYHSIRLGEGKDTGLDPEKRKETILNAKKAGLEIYDALEPVGPEHTPQELAERILFSRSINVYQSGSMKRTPVPGTPFYERGDISDFSLSKVLAAQVLAFASMDRFPIIGTHEPNLIGYISGADMISAESGINPRDTAEDTIENRGFDILKCKAMLKEAGFEHIVLGDGTIKDLF